MPDVILAMVDYLQAQSDVTGLVPAARIWDFEIPPQYPVDAAMPEKGVIIRPHGGPRDPGPIELNYSRFQAVCFGETPHLAYTVYWAVHLALKRLVASPSVWASTYIHNVIQQSGPVYGRDPTLTWPYQIAVYDVKASDLTPP